MGLHRLKSFRVGLAILFFTLIAFLFVDFRNIVAPSVAEGLLYLQFVPSLLKFVNVAALGAAGFIVRVIFTVLFGRVYCSTISPLRTLQTHNTDCGACSDHCPTKAVDMVPYPNPANKRLRSRK